MIKTEKIINEFTEKIVITMVLIVYEMLKNFVEIRVLMYFYFVFNI